MLWIRQHAVPLLTDDPRADDADLERALGPALGPARVVGLGEATHGTHEFFRIKHRLVEYLVRRRSFLTFAMEADGAASCALDAYLQTGQGDPARLIRGLRFWTWDTQEFLDLIRWLRAYNATVTPASAVSFRGIDMQNPVSASRQVVSFLEQADPPSARAAQSAYSCLGPDDPNAIWDQYRLRDVDDQVACAHQIAQMRQRLQANRERYEPPSPSAYRCALQSAHLLEEAEVVLRSPDVRDHFYAENIRTLLESAGRGSKLIVWAHNGHIANAFGAMGRSLKKQLGPEYFPICATFYDGTFRSRPPRNQPADQPSAPLPISAPTPARDSYEQALHRTGMSSLLIDLRPLAGPASPATLWLLGPHPHWDIGATYEAPFSTPPSRLPDECDALLFVDTTHPSIPLAQEAGPSR